MVKLKNAKRFALKLTSLTTRLGRESKINAMGICLEDGSIFIVDIMKLEEISSDLQSVLGNNKIKKLMFDCRSSADCLHYKYKIKLSGVIDLQLVQYLKEYPERPIAKRLPTFLKMVEKNLSPEASQQLHQLKDNVAWDQKLISDGLIQYIVKEISLYPLVYKILSNNIPKDIEKLSGKFAQRRIRFPNYDARNPYWKNDFMPWHVFGAPRGGAYKCYMCDISLDKSYYKSVDLKRGKQECTVCTAVTKDIQNNRTIERPENYDSWVHPTNKKEKHRNSYSHEDRHISTQSSRKKRKKRESSK